MDQPTRTESVRRGRGRNRQTTRRVADIDAAGAGYVRKGQRGDRRIEIDAVRGGRGQAVRHHVRVGTVVIDHRASGNERHRIGGAHQSQLEVAADGIQLDAAIGRGGVLRHADSMGLPMIVNAPIPGQEERNADYLLEQGVAMKAFDSVTLEYRVRYLLNNPAKLADMREKALALGRPDAACAVLATVMPTTA